MRKDCSRQLVKFSSPCIYQKRRNCHLLVLLVLLRCVQIKEFESKQLRDKINDHLEKNIPLINPYMYRTCLQ